MLLATITENHPSLLIMGLVACALLALAFTSYRYVLGYFFAGMGYWLVVEGLHWVTMTAARQANLPLQDLHGYVLAVGLTLVPILLVLNRFERRQTVRVTRSKTILWRRIRPFLAKTAQQTRPTHPMIAGHRPFAIERDTDFDQHFIRHTPVFDYDK